CCVGAAIAVRGRSEGRIQIASPVGVMHRARGVSGQNWPGTSRAGNHHPSSTFRRMKPPRRTTMTDMHEVTRRTLLATSAAAGIGSAVLSDSAMAGGGPAIRPFHVHFPDSDLADLKRRIAATRWADRELVADASQGVQQATMQKLIDYWGTQHD